MTLVWHSQFKRDWKRYRGSGLDLSSARDLLRLLADGGPLPQRCRDHSLHGEYQGRRECRVRPDWLVIYKREGDTIVLERMGSHSELFE